jgi:tRNA (cytidine/uridine-2'-O-)-methyltransferase
VTGPLFHVVLHEPEIPNNTGNIGRTCVATACRLHLIRPLGFDTSEKACRRAGLDYWARLRVREHSSWGAYLRSARPRRLWLFTARSARPCFDAQLRRGDHLVFGKETSGLPDELLARYQDRLLTLPMAPGERSLNLATAVCAAVYEGVRQLLARGEVSVDASGRLIVGSPAPIG